MKIACLSFTNKGKELGNIIMDYSVNHDEAYRVDHYINEKIESGIKGQMDFIVNEYDGLVFICAVGIAIRMMSPYIKHKTIDPAVVAIDDSGNYSISLLSGHIGGGNELAKWIAKTVGAAPIITTATDNRGIESIDVFALKNNYYMEDMDSIKKITAMMVNGKKVGFYSEMGSIINYNNLVVLRDLESIPSDIYGLIIVSSRKLKVTTTEICRLIPRNVNIGIGCRRGMNSSNIIRAIEQELNKQNLFTKGIKSVGTVEVKRDEEGIIETVKHFDCPLKVFSIGEIKEVEEQFEKSQFVKSTLGIYSVAEPCAYMLGGDIISRKTKHNGITLSIRKETLHG